MKRKKHIPLIVLLIVIGSFACGQDAYVDSLKNRLPSLHDTARVNCLNEIAVFYVTRMFEDSTKRYIDIVYEEAKKINYARGIACSFMLRAGLANHFNDDYSTMEQMAEQALHWFGQTSNNEDIAIAYWQLGFAAFRLGNYSKGLANSKLAYEWGKQSGAEVWIASSLETLTDIYRERGEYDSLLKAQNELINWDRKWGDTREETQHTLWVLGLMNKFLEDYPAAVKYWRQLFQADWFQYVSPVNQSDYVEMLTLAGEPDSARLYMNLFEKYRTGEKWFRFFLVCKGELLLFNNHYDSALVYLRKGLLLHRASRDFAQEKRTLLDIAKAYTLARKDDSAVYYSRKVLAMATPTNSKPDIRDAYELLWTVYDRTGNKDSAYYFYREFIRLKGIVLNDRTKAKVATYRYEQQIAALETTRVLQQDQLKQASQQKKFIIAGLAILLLLGLILFRNSLLKRKNAENRRVIAENELLLQQFENQHAKAQAELRATELEMQALRAQMNPHFIFNALNSINRFILQNNRGQALEYLTKFSKLVRLILQNSRSSLISIDSELEALRLYLDLETLRFNDHFSYEIDVSPDLDTEILKIPPLVIQPYAENAIWHGLMHKQESGLLSIRVQQGSDETIIISIADNGIGREQSKQYRNTDTIHKSMGLTITGDRIRALQTGSNAEPAVAIHDLTDADGKAAGTEVVIKIPVLYD